MPKKRERNLEEIRSEVKEILGTPEAKERIRKGREKRLEAIMKNNAFSRISRQVSLSKNAEKAISDALKGKPNRLIKILVDLQRQIIDLE